MHHNLAQITQSVVLVDDDELIRKCLAELLEDAGWRVTAAASAEQALQTTDVGRGPDILVTDMLLGCGMNGLALIGAARNRWPLIRAVLISGADIPDPALAVGDRYLRKPFTSAAMIRLVTDLAGPGHLDRGDAAILCQCLGDTRRFRQGPLR